MRKRLVPSAENIAFVIFVAFLVLYPFGADDFGVLNLAYFLAITMLALSLALIWGHAGILSFGKTAFFGIGGYMYGIYTHNYTWNGSTLDAIVVGVLAGGMVAAILGYFMF